MKFFNRCFLFENSNEGENDRLGFLIFKLKFRKGDVMIFQTLVAIFLGFNLISFLGCGKSKNSPSKTNNEVENAAIKEFTSEEFDQDMAELNRLDDIYLSYYNDFDKTYDVQTRYQIIKNLLEKIEFILQKYSLEFKLSNDNLNTIRVFEDENLWRGRTEILKTEMTRLEKQIIYQKIAGTWVSESDQTLILRNVSFLDDPLKMGNVEYQDNSLAPFFYLSFYEVENSQSTFLIKGNSRSINEYIINYVSENKIELINPKDKKVVSFTRNGLGS